MFMYLLLAGFGAVGFAVWIGILKLWEFYEQQTPPEIQTRLHTTAKNLPRDAFNLVAACLFWLSLGALLVQFTLGCFGLDGWLPNTSWALSVVTFFIIGGLINFWEEPGRSDPIKPRGRALDRKGEKKGAKQTSRPAKPTDTTRGRTIRSYHDIR